MVMGITALWLASLVWKYARKGRKQDRVHVEFSHTVISHSSTKQSEAATPEFDNARLSV
jgi:hypothetical protein